MFSAYFHEAIANCIFWGLFKSGALRTTVKDGNIPQLRLITDLFGGLIPELPKHYPKKGMLLQIDMIEAPTVGGMSAGAWLGRPGDSTLQRVHSSWTTMVRQHCLLLYAYSQDRRMSPAYGYMLY